MTGDLVSGERPCARCGDQVQYLSSDNLCDGCVSAATEHYRSGAVTAEMALCGPDGIVRGGVMHHGTDYPCTGHAHYAGQHIRCTSLAHADPYYDRDELARPGHVPQLVSGRFGAMSACSCGFRFDVGTLTEATTAIRDHIAAVDDMNTVAAPGASGVALIAAERLRQVDVEGWTLQHDAEHTAGDLARAAACYALPEAWRSDDIWPWHSGWWKPSPDDRIRELVKAGALIAAEIDRLQAKDGAR